MTIKLHIVGITLALAGLCLFSSCRDRLAEGYEFYIRKR